MTAAPLSVVFSVGGVILEQPHVCTGLWVKTLPSSGRATVAPWRHDLLRGVVSRDPFRLVAFLGHCLGGNGRVGISATWQGEWVLLSPRGGFRNFGGNRRLSLGCRCGGLQRIAAAGVAWQLSVRRGTMSKDGACGNDTRGQLGLQRTAAGRLVWLSYPVHYIVGRWRKRHLRLAATAAEVMFRG